MGQVLSRAPVYFAAAQIRHNPIAAIADSSVRRQIQEAFRSLGYPDQKEVKQSIFVEGDEANVELKQPPQLLFMNTLKTSAVVIQQDRFWLQTTSYLDFEDFKKAFLAGLSVLHNIVKLDYIDSLSMRMLDAIVPGPNESLSQYLPESILGLDAWAESRGWQLLHQGADHVFQTAKHRIVFSCVRRPSQVGFPPNCVPVGMALLARHNQVQCVHAVLDTDAALEKRQEIDLILLGQQLVDVKKDLSQCFRNIVTSYALEQWK